MSTNVVCTIENHATLFALFAKYASVLAGANGRKAILAGVTKYGNERGARMAEKARLEGDPITPATYQAYGEWVIEYPDQMIFENVRNEPSFQTRIYGCGWCNAWRKHDLLQYGKLYCVDIDNAVYQGFIPEYACTPVGKFMSSGNESCTYDWEGTVTEEELQEVERIKKRIGLKYKKDFNYHTSHLFNTVSGVIKEKCPDEAQAIIKLATDDYVGIFGQPYLDVLTIEDKEWFFNKLKQATETEAKVG